MMAILERHLLSYILHHSKTKDCHVLTTDHRASPYTLIGMSSTTSVKKSNGRKRVLVVGAGAAGQYIFFNPSISTYPA